MSYEGRHRIPVLPKTEKIIQLFPNSREQTRYTALGLLYVLLFFYFVPAWSLDIPHNQIFRDFFTLPSREGMVQVQSLPVPDPTKIKTQADFGLVVNGWGFPLNQLSACFAHNGEREFGTVRPGHIHGGIDLGGTVGVHWGDPIYAMHEGIVYWGEDPGGAGHYLYLVDIGDNYGQSYFHMSSRVVQDGDHVLAGQLIGFVGQTGDAIFPHLHLETWLGNPNNRINPELFIWEHLGIWIGCGTPLGDITPSPTVSPSLSPSISFSSSPSPTPSPTSSPTLPPTPSPSPSPTTTPTPTPTTTHHGH